MFVNMMQAFYTYMYHANIWVIAISLEYLDQVIFFLVIFFSIRPF